MYRNIVLTLAALGFWICIGIFGYTQYQKYKPMKIDESKFLNRLNGKWRRVSDNEEIEYLALPTNTFNVLNNKKGLIFYYYKEGDIQFSDISVSDSVNYIFTAKSLNDFGDDRSDVDIRIMNDSIFKAYNKYNTDTYIKIKQ